MQLKPKKNKTKNITLALAGATTALLTGLSPAQAKLTGSISNLYYSETDRVTAIEPVISLNAEFEGERVWSNKLVIDTLTGASHSGAVMSRNPQTFTTPSGGGNYTIAPGQVALDPTFKDTRIALASAWSQPFGESWEFSTGFNGSKEYDFISMAVNGSISKYFYDKNTKLSFGLSYESDSINPVGGVPEGLSTMNSKIVLDTKETKNVQDILIGITQVIRRNWIVQLNYNLGVSSGYMSDPYKFTSEVLAPTDLNAGDPNGILYYDKRPDKRTKNALFVDSKYHLEFWGILGTSYRYFFDDWGVTSHTFQVNHTISLGTKWYLEPSFRYYSQSAADFYKYFHQQGTALPEFMTSDYRLGEMTALTYSLEIGRKLDEYGKEISFRAQLYQQTGNSSPAEAYGYLRNQDLFPTVTAVIGQIIYKF